MFIHCHLASTRRHIHDFLDFGITENIHIEIRKNFRQKWITKQAAVFLKNIMQYLQDSS